MSGKPKLYREYDEKTGELIKLECGKCHEIKTADCFCKDKSKKDGVKTKCSQCDSERSRLYRENNPEYDRRYNESHKEERHEYHCQYRGNHKEERRQYRENHKEEKREYDRQRYENNKEKMSERHRQYYGNKAHQEIMKIYENVTKQRYPHNGVQYGIVYGVQNLITNRWYIGQTTTSFNVRYYGDFFNHKIIELSEDSSKGQLLADDIEKYGQENFEIIEVIDVAFSERELDEKEAYYIDYYKAYDEGYNSNRGNIFKHGKEKRRNNNEIYK